MSVMDMAIAVDAAALARHDTNARDLGIEVVEAASGRAVTRIRVVARHVNFNGVRHGGLTFTLSDAAFGYACNLNSIMSAGIDVRMMYNAPAQVGAVLTATATEIARSARIGSYRGDVVRTDGTPVAAMSGTAFIAGKPSAA